MKRLLEMDVLLTARMRVAERPGLLRSLSAVLAHSGDSWFWLIGLAGLWFLGPPPWKGRAQALAIGVLVTAAFVMLIKFTVRRRRPEGTWGGIYRNTDPHSFPSGHAARSVLLAVMAVWLGPPWFAGLLAVWAPLVGLARVAMGVHYLSDIVAGMLLGAAMGFMFAWFY
ncbi:MAG: phosphatase PAP2 family protein [Chloroflexota bacterium]|nr:MAG: phosphatase PAP2 family protein [Chloroflexota bacterium]